MIRASRPAPLLRITAVLAIAACLRWDRSGTVEAYEPCRYLKDCAAGLRCVRWIGSGGAICSPTCSLEAECLLPEGFATLHATCHFGGGLPGPLQRRVGPVSCRARVSTVR